jgi:phosphate acetyltransferase
VLPEGEEPRTVKAASISQERGIARCVLIGRPAEIERVAEAQGVTLPEGLEIIEPTAVAPALRRAHGELRRHKGMTSRSPASSCSTTSCSAR